MGIGRKGNSCIKFVYWPVPNTNFQLNPNEKKICAPRVPKFAYLLFPLFAFKYFIYTSNSEWNTLPNMFALSHQVIPALDNLFLNISLFRCLLSTSFTFFPSFYFVCQKKLSFHCPKRHRSRRKQASNNAHIYQIILK